MPSGATMRCATPREALDLRTQLRARRRERSNPNLDVGFARRIERELIETSRVMGVDAEMRPVWQKFMDELIPYSTGTVNGKTVYYIAESIINPTENHGLFEPGDQPINLEGTVFPGENLAIGGDPRELEIARNSLEEMHSWGATPGPNLENGFCKIFPIAARIGWPAGDLVAKFRASIRYLWRPSNLTCSRKAAASKPRALSRASIPCCCSKEAARRACFPTGRRPWMRRSLACAPKERSSSRANSAGDR